MRKYFLSAAFCLWVGFGISALYAQSTCPTGILLDLSRAASVCYQLGDETACYANGTVSATAFDGTNALPQVGDKASVTQLQSLSLSTAPDEISLAVLNLPSDLALNSGQAVSLIALGDVTLTNAVEPLPMVSVIATGQLNIRHRPQDNADVIGRSGVNTVLSANGRTADSQWFRVQVRNTDLYGWASATVLKPQGNAAQLQVVAQDSPIYRPFEHFSLNIGDSVFCEGGLPSGVLLQTDSAVPVRFIINQTPVQLQGTAFITDENGLSLVMVTGFALLGEDQIYLPAGALGSVGQALTPYVPADYAALPLGNLPVSVRLPESITADEIAQRTADYAASQALSLATPVPPATPNPNTCLRTSRSDTSLYAGPGRFYEVINPLRTGQQVMAHTQTTDADGRIWWQLSNSNWVLAADIREQGACDDLPYLAHPQAPSHNQLSLETCETTNGPLRQGQWVEIYFMPPPWNNFGEARDAVAIDPGRISIGSRTYRASASEMIRIPTAGPEDRYARRFFIHWTAEAGTFRIAGDRLTYEPICTLTVTAR